MSWRRRSRHRRDRQRRTLRQIAQHQPRRGKRRHQLHRGRLGAHDPSRRQARQASRDHHAEQGLQPADRCRPRVARRVRAEPAARGGRRRDDPFSADRQGAIRDGQDQGRRGGDRPLAATSSAGARRSHKGAWRVRREHVPGLSWRPLFRRTDPRVAARMAAGRQPDARRRQRDAALRHAGKIRRDVADGEEARRNRRQRRDAFRVAKEP